MKVVFKIATLSQRSTHIYIDSKEIEKFQSSEHLLSTPMHTTNLSIAANRHLPQMGRAAHPVVVTSNLDLRHETGDIGSNSIG